MSKFIGQTFIDPTANEANNRLEDVPCDASVFVGAWVRLNASSIAVNALADSRANSKVIGIVEDKPSTTTCTVRFGGITIEDLDLAPIHGALDPEDTYFLSESSAGLMTDTPPSADGEIVKTLGEAYNSGRFIVDIKIGVKRNV